MAIHVLASNEERLSFVLVVPIGVQTNGSVIALVAERFSAWIYTSIAASTCATIIQRALAIEGASQTTSTAAANNPRALRAALTPTTM